MLRKMLGLDDKPKQICLKPFIKIEEVEVDPKDDFDDSADFGDEYGPVEAIADYSGEEDIKRPIEEMEYLSNFNLVSSSNNKPFKSRITVSAFGMPPTITYEGGELDEDQHKCNECNAVFKNRYSLKRHSYVHSDEIFECEKCDKKYRRKDKLRRHFLTVHPGVVFECDKCSATFVDKKKLKKHLLFKQCKPVSAKDVIFECFVCNRTFKSNAGLIRHSEVHKVLASLCAYCEKDFKRKDLLDMHMHTEHGVELPPVDITGLSCEICGKSFKKMFKLKVGSCLNTLLFLGCNLLHSHSLYPSSDFNSISIVFQEHLLTHSDERSFLCNQCGQGFKTKTSLRLHELRHQPEKPFQCEECPKSYYQAKELKQHVGSAHRGRDLGFTSSL